MFSHRFLKHVIIPLADKAMGTSLTKDWKEIPKMNAWSSDEIARWQDDMVDALISWIDYQDSFGVFNVGYGESYSVKEIAEIVIEISGKQVSLNFSEQKRASEVNDLICNNHRLLVETGWSPKTPLRDGLRLTYLAT